MTTTDCWMLHRLTGEFVTDVTTASRSLLLGIDRVRWDTELLTIFGLGAEDLPRLVANDEVIGSTDAFGETIPVAGAIVDQQAALLGHGCLSPGMTKCTYGTGAFLVANLGHTARRFDNGLTTSIAWDLRGRTTYCVDAQLYTAASAIRWLVDLGLISRSEELDTVAAADAGGVRCVPAFAGLAAPWWQPRARALLSGIGLETGRAEIVRSVVDGLAAQIAELVRVLVAEIPAASSTGLRVDGGLTGSKVLMQVQADVLQQPVELFSSPHATALGAAACARLALDPNLDISSALLPQRERRRYLPAISPEAAAEFLSSWRTALGQAKETHE